MVYDLDIPGGYSLDTIRADDEEALVEHLQDPEISRGTLTIPYPYESRHAQTFIHMQRKENRGRDEPVAFVIRDRGGRLVGAIGLKVFDGPSCHRAELGYWVAGPCQGRGLASAAVRRVARHGFERVRLGKLEAHVYEWNRASTRVLEKCGFRREGMLRQHFLKGGEARDVIVYGLLPEDLCVQ